MFEDTHATHTQTHTQAVGIKDVGTVSECECVNYVGSVSGFG